MTHYIRSGNTVNIAEKDIDVSVYHTRIILKPENVIPEFDISVGEQ